MSLMRFVGDPEMAVHNLMNGVKFAFPSFTVDADEKIVINNQICENQVCLLAGGGSGHEPFAAGFVGAGMLAGAVAGTVFASPPTGTILDAICTLAELNKNSGVLVIHQNYTGDVLNFGVAVERARSMRKINVELVVTDDDCSRTGDQLSRAGKRGMCGTCFVMKIGGSMAAKGASLSDVTKECNLIKTKMATNGAAVTACTLPGQKPLFEIPFGEIDLGLGIHGEAGIRRTKLMPIEELVEIMLSQIIKTLNLSSGNRVCVLVNNLGAVSSLELGIISSTAAHNLAKKNIEVVRLYYGPFITSLDMAGFQISLLNISDNERWLEHLDDKTSAPGWGGTFHSAPLLDSSCAIKVVKCGEERISNVGPKLTAAEQKLFEKCLKTISNYLIQVESKLNELDTTTGDGDAGTTLKYLAEGILNKISSFELEYPATVFSDIGHIALKEMGGTSGALYGIMVTVISDVFLTESSVDWIKAGSAAIKVLLKYSTAQLGDRTMIDALLPAFEEFSKQIKNNKDASSACAAALKIAEQKCEETKHMKAKLGRASYVPAEYVHDVDPGAYGVTIWLKAICDTMHQSS